MSSTISEQIFEALKEQIIRGQLVAGDRLAQDHIARDFNTSHVPVREAFLRLQSHRLAISIPRRGMRVAALEPAELREVSEMRIALEPLALGHAAAVITPRELARIESHRLACDDAQDAITWERANRMFHQALLAPCQMPRLLSVIDDLHIASARHFFQSGHKRWEPRQDSDHAAIMRNLRRRDISAAVEILRRHLRRAR